MKKETLFNLIMSVIAALFCVLSIVFVLFWGAWWHLFSALLWAALANIFYKDDEYCIESVQHYLARKWGK